MTDLANPEQERARVRIERRPAVVGLPEDMYVEYFGAIKDGTEFIIYRPRDDWNYPDFRVLLRRPGAHEFALHEITRITRFRDGGTTDIEVEAGQFHFPTPFSPGEKATFNGEELTRYAD